MKPDPSRTVPEEVVQYSGTPNPLRTSFRFIFRIITLSYSGVFAYHTLDPITNIVASQNDARELVKSLKQFRQLKEEELLFVSKAATLSGAAVLGVFSWPTVETTIWTAKMIWHWSFFMSCFALIGSAHQRLLRHLPGMDDDDSFDDERLDIALNLFLRPSEATAVETKHRHMSIRMLWVWQCPTMLMSHSWVFFVAGYALHLLSPIFDPALAEISPTVRGL
ncbi:hypothetical protein F5X68DRAFT_227306 [Plectosphaerella plurivora]|uniref:Uncharacterized protein n=1 Tax=Plectosphaerella plurivora TaxID=936078 RepID=A0A9P9AEQ2_9PEZI|nr:hypothetical protein F5X68DRAFT_227306 [Plectosphaerella plurivora]